MVTGLILSNGEEEKKQSKGLSFEGTLVSLSMPSNGLSDIVSTELGVC